jgi:hypothetical protein
MHICNASNLSLPLRVTFIVEAAVDSSGPRREFATVFSQAIGTCTLVNRVAAAKDFQPRRGKPY